MKVGAIESHVIDVKDEFAEDVLVAHKDTFYERKYPLVSSEPTISRNWLNCPQDRGDNHCPCTGRKRQVRFEVAIASLDPSLS